MAKLKGIKDAVDNWNRLKRFRLATMVGAALLVLLGFAILFRITLQAGRIQDWEIVAGELSVAVALSLFALRSAISEMIEELEEQSKERFEHGPATLEIVTEGLE